MLPRKKNVEVSPDEEPDPGLELFVPAVQEAARKWPKHSAPPLIRAAVAGDQRALRRYRIEGLNVATRGGQSPLHWVVVRGTAGVLRRLRYMGRLRRLALHVDATDARGLTPLHYAAVTRSAWAVHDLLAVGAAVDSRDRNGQTPLMKAANWNDPQLCKQLLDEGADVRAVDNVGMTALHVAAGGNAEGVVQLLVRRGARAGAADVVGRTPLRNALCRADADRAMRRPAPAAALALLPRGHSPLHANQTGRTELHWAAAKGTQDIVRRLITSAGPSWPSRLRDKDGMTPLMCAMQVHNEDTVKVLLDLNNCFEEDTDKLGWNALHWAARSGMAWAVDLLLKGKWSAQRRDGEGRDVLSLALVGQDKDTVRTVLQHYSFKQSADHFDRTALHYAVMHNSPEAALALLQKGAQADAFDNQGFTPLGRAHFGHQLAVVDILSCYATISRN